MADPTEVEVSDEQYQEFIEWLSAILGQDVSKSNYFKNKAQAIKSDQFKRFLQAKQAGTLPKIPETQQSDLAPQISENAEPELPALFNRSMQMGEWIIPIDRWRSTGITLPYVVELGDEYQSKKETRYYELFYPEIPFEDINTESLDSAVYDNLYGVDTETGAYVNNGKPLTRLELFEEAGVSPERLEQLKYDMTVKAFETKAQEIGLSKEELRSTSFLRNRIAQWTQSLVTGEQVDYKGDLIPMPSDMLNQLNTLATFIPTPTKLTQMGVDYKKMGSQFSEKIDDYIEQWAQALLKGDMDIEQNAQYKRNLARIIGPEAGQQEAAFKFIGGQAFGEKQRIYPQYFLENRTEEVANAPSTAGLRKLMEQPEGVEQVESAIAKGAEIAYKESKEQQLNRTMTEQKIRERTQQTVSQLAPGETVNTLPPEVQAQKQQEQEWESLVKQARQSRVRPERVTAL